jgi:hypothetical protein
MNVPHTEEMYINAPGPGTPNQLQLPGPIPPTDPESTGTTTLKRIFKYEQSDSYPGMVIFNTEPETLDYFQILYQIHSLIDEKHDQLAGNRGNDLKSKDMKYKNQLISAINKSTLGNIQSFSTGVTLSTLKTYDVNSGIHTLENALERLGDSFMIQIENGAQINAPPLPSLQILPWICPKSSPDKFANNMVVYKNFNTDTCDNSASGHLVKTEIGPNSTGFVHDTGSSEIFQRITATVNGNGDTRNVVSGKLDSSTTAGPLTIANNQENVEKLQTLIPFMDIYSNQGVRMGVIMIYVAPHNITIDGGYHVFVAFKYIPLEPSNSNYNSIYSHIDILPVLSRNRSTNISSLTPANGWLSYTITDQVPNLPEISDYMAGARGCFSAILKKIFSGDQLVNKCAPYKDIALTLWQNNLNNGNTVFQNDSDLFIMAFLMKVKWLGDLFRLIDSFMLTEAYTAMPTATATIDTFMKRFACLSNLYVYCANKGSDLTINDVKTLTPEQMYKLRAQAAAQQIETQKKKYELELAKKKDKIDRINTKIAWYKELITQLTTFQNNNWIPAFVMLILNGILNPANITTGELRMSRRIITIMVGCLTNQSYIYDKITFTHNEMKSILDYFLTLFYYHIAFDDIVNNSTLVGEVGQLQYINVDGMSDDDIMSVDTTPSESIFNTIDENMNIMEKYNSISKFIPKYTGTIHRVLFDDSAYLLSKNIAEISTVRQFFLKQQSSDGVYSQLTKLPELNYEPNVGSIITTYFGNIITKYFGNIITRLFPVQRVGGETEKDRENKRKKDFKKGIDHEEAATRRKEEAIRIRRDNKSDALDERRSIMTINSSRQELMDCLHKLNESLFTNSGYDINALINKTNELSTSETNLRFKILYNLFYKHDNADNILKDYDTIFNFFEINNFNQAFIAALQEINNEISNYKNINIIVTKYFSHESYTNDYLNLKKDIDDFNSIYTNIANEFIIDEVNYIYTNIENEDIIKILKLYRDDRELNFTKERNFTTERILTGLQAPNYFDVHAFTSKKQPQQSAFTMGPSSSILAKGGNSKKHRKTKKKNSKSNKKNSGLKKSHKKTKRKPSK